MMVVIVIVAVAMAAVVMVAVRRVMVAVVMVAAVMPSAVGNTPAAQDVTDGAVDRSRSPRGGCSLMASQLLATPPLSPALPGQPRASEAAGGADGVAPCTPNTIPDENLLKEFGSRHLDNMASAWRAEKGGDVGAVQAAMGQTSTMLCDLHNGKASCG